MDVDLLVLGDAHPDLVLRGSDVEPSFRGAGGRLDALERRSAA